MRADEWIDKRTRSWANPSWWHVLITAPWFLGAVFFVYEATVDSGVAKREKTVLGIIVAHEAWNHDQYRYTFIVNGTSYLGLDNPPSELSKIGDPVLVYYDPGHPAKNALKDFADKETQVLGPVPLCLFGVCWGCLLHLAATQEDGTAAATG